MSNEPIGAGALDYAPWHLAGSRLALRGPGGAATGRYVAVLGGLETYGRFVERPYPALLQDRLGLPCVNLAAAHAGPDAFLADEAVLRTCAGAAATVISVSGAHLVRNRFYTVHRHRNDRVIGHDAALRALYPEVDVSQHTFVRHLLGDLERVSPARMATVRAELQSTWIDRMARLCERIGGNIVLLWMGRRAPDDPALSIHDEDPVLVTREMLIALGDRFHGRVEAIDRSAARDALAGKVFAAGEARAAARLPGPALHRQAAEQLEKVLRPLLATQAPAVRTRTA